MVAGPAFDLVMSLFLAVTLFMVMIGLSGLSSFFWLSLEVFGIPLTLFLHGKYNSNTFGLLGSLPSVVVDNWDLTLSICSCFSMYLTFVISVIYLQTKTNSPFKSQDSKAPSKKRFAISRKSVFGSKQRGSFSMNLQALFLNMKFFPNKIDQFPSPKSKLASPTISKAHKSKLAPPQNSTEARSKLGSLSYLGKTLVSTSILVPLSRYFSPDLCCLMSMIENFKISRPVLVCFLLICFGPSPLLETGSE